MEEGTIWASEIVQGIYLGAGRDAQNLAKMREHGITHVLNCADDVPNYHEIDHPELKYLCLNIGDFGSDSGSGRTFGVAAEFCEEALKTGQSKVLIHCANGSNRSATVTIAVLMRLRGLSLALSWARVHAQREQASPLADNRAQLLEFEVELRGVASMEEGDRGVLVPVLTA